MTELPRRPALLLLLLSAALAMPATAPATPGDDDPDEDDRRVLGPTFELPTERARSSRSTPARRSSGMRFQASLGGGLAAGNLWMDYSVDSRYREAKDGLVQDEEQRTYYFLAKPAVDLELGLETANEHLVLGFHVGVTGMSQRVSAAMVAEWANDTESVIDRIGERRYSPAMVLIGIGGRYVFGPDRKFSPMIGARFGIGVTWDADFHMIDAWDDWYKNEQADIEEGLYFRYRVPLRGGLDAGLRWNIDDRFGVALHVPVEVLATHGYVRGVIVGANARFVVRL